VEEYKTALYGAREALREFVNENNTNPIMLRTAWHDAGSLSGACGSIRFEAELNHGANAGLSKVIKLYLTPIKNKFPAISWADLIQLAGAVAVEQAGGPKINMRYGRLDAQEPSADGGLPGALPEWKEKTAGAHLRAVFNRMGLFDRDIVALSGAHTIGRAFSERSGTVDHGYNKGTRYTMPPACPRFDSQPGFGMSGGMSWTPKWLNFDNSYFTQVRSVKDGGSGKEMKDELLWLPTDAVLTTDKGFAPFFNMYAKSQDAFFEDYAESHRRLSENGARWAVTGGIMLSDYPKSRL
jgi:L-ascorbate peroxidase